MHIVVDVMNVIGSRPDGWWRDRPGAARRLIAALRRFAADSGDEIVAVLDGRPLPGLPEGVAGRVGVFYAAGGPNAADRRIVSFLAAEPEPGAWTVVTSDAALARDVRALGAHVEGARAWRERLDALEDTPGQ
ncbi:MAG: NYN domain-containing protein [Chloroflexi bacterium]|nr:NYN domain-containing protein [Chloroflexota bacterium]MDA1004666.1 NYN domain-containing protein [Chloroflexota bacterium]